MRKTTRPLVVALLLAAFTVASLGLGTTAQAAPPVLAKEGDHSVTVLRIQGVLLALKKLEVGYNDGYYTSRTTDSVRSMQAALGLPQTGVMDQTTYEKMVALWRAKGSPAAENPVYAREGSRGIVVLRFQNILVGIKKLAPGYNTGTYDAMTRNAVQALQRDEGLPVTGVMNLVTYKRFLVKWYAMGKPLPKTTTKTTTPSSKVVARPGDVGIVVTRLQNILIGIKMLAPGYAGGSYNQMTVNAVKAFQRSKGLTSTGVIDQTTYDAMLKTWYAMGKPLPPSGSSNQGVRLDSRCLSGAKVICINKTTRKLYYVTNGKIQRSFDIRVGRPGYETREGTFTVFRKELKSWSKPYQVWMPYSMYFSGGQAIHFSYEFASYGYLQGSHGCVNMRDWNGIAWMYSQVSIGTKLVVYH